ncbi:hypothetical protein E2562_038405 [Oryza meyeriana var. granulata]|uniref:Uncharacterized protein n=1 Tax=Oryza meyeriana var. granulata TaxID=110450 RepID=A0A6G1E7H6_9ORYZ|nr:hypothetical protein E2562_038405 [Oryza meyeriana var. granulata]
MKMTLTPERHPFVGSPWGFTDPKPRPSKEVGPDLDPEAPSSLWAGEAEAIAALLEANLPPRRGQPLGAHRSQGGWSNLGAWS